MAVDSSRHAARALRTQEYRSGTFIGWSGAVPAVRPPHTDKMPQSLLCVRFYGDQAMFAGRTMGASATRKPMCPRDNGQIIRSSTEKVGKAEDGVQACGLFGLDSFREADWSPIESFRSQIDPEGLFNALLAAWS